MSLIEPRIDGALLQKYKGRKVRLVGQVQHVDMGTQMISVTASDGIVVNVKSEAGLQIPVGHFAEFGGQEDGGILHEIVAVDFGAKFG